MLRRTLIALGASLALVLGTGAAALADERAPDSPPDICIPSEGSAAVETTYKDVPNPDYVPSTPAVPGTPGVDARWNDLVWHNYTGNYDGSGQPPLDDPAWHAPGSDPNGQKHEEGKLHPNVPYQTGEGNGSWFLWTGTWAPAVPATPAIPAVPARGEPTIRVVDVPGHDAVPAVTCDAASVDFHVTVAPSCTDRDGAASLTWKGAHITDAVFDDVPMTPAEFGLFYSGDYPGPLAGHYRITYAADPGYSFGQDHTTLVDFRMPAAFTDEDCAAPVAPPGITVTTCEQHDILPVSTDVDTRGWVLKPESGSAYVEGGLRLDGTVGAGSAWARLDLPAGTHLSDIAGGLGTDLVASSGIWWGGVILDGGDLSAQLHYDSDGRFWTSQQGIFPDATLKGGYYESNDVAVDALVDPIVGSLRIYVNEGQSAVVGSQDVGCHTQPFASLAPLVGEPGVPTDPAGVPTDPAVVPTDPALVDEVLAADASVPAGFYSQVLAAEDPAAAELAQTGSDGVAITLGAALILGLSGLGLTVIRRRGTR